MSERTCSIEGCDRKTHAKGLCGAHYQSSYRSRVADPCEIADCDKIAASRGWCPMHYQRWRHYGDPLIATNPAGRRKRPKHVGVDPCAIDGCDKVILARGWCSAHYTRFLRTGAPVVESRKPGEIRNGCKICTGCGADKPVDTAYGAGQSQCRACQAEHMRQRRAAGLYKAPETPRVERVCECGKMFLADKRRSRYCSVECKAAFKNANNWQYMMARRARLKEALVEPFNRIDIFERDAWICQLCQEPIDKELSFPDRMSASLDHIIPISRGGTHEPSNAQASHMVCNVRKSNKIVDRSA